MKYRGELVILCSNNMRHEEIADLVARFIPARAMREEAVALIRRLCGPDVPAMGYALPLEEEFLVSTDEMVEAMRSLAKF